VRTRRGICFYPFRHSKTCENLTAYTTRTLRVFVNNLKNLELFNAFFWMETWLLAFLSSEMVILIKEKINFEIHSKFCCCLYGCNIFAKDLEIKSAHYTYCTSEVRRGWERPGVSYRTCYQSENLKNFWWAKKLSRCWQYTNGNECYVWSLKFEVHWSSLH